MAARSRRRFAHQPEDSLPAHIAASTAVRKVVTCVALCALLVLPVSAFLYIGSRLSTAPLPLGKPVPILDFSTLEGNYFSVGTHLGKKCVLVFFRVECQHCKTALANLESLYQMHKDSVEVLAVSLSSLEKTRQLLSQGEFSFPLLLDHTGDARHLYRITTVPALFVTDEHQVLRIRRVGASLFQEDATFLDLFLSGKSHEKAR